jgi:hypothetical protein
MGNKIRVFISSTMKDLKNERAAVAEIIAGFNFEPVNAELWATSTLNSWQTILGELESSHLFVLLLGERYGWVPTRGPGADRGLSVTEMEFDRARELGKPVLAFLQKLDPDSPRDSPDAQRAKAFRDRITNWETGYFVRKFDAARDLAREVASALGAFLSDRLLELEEQAHRLQQRSRSVADAPVSQAPTPARLPPPVLPRTLIEAVARRQAVLLAGAGMSLAAGYPSARALGEVLLAYRDGESALPEVARGASFEELAGEFEATFGKQALTAVIRRAMSGPQGVSPTSAHLNSVMLFPFIVTSNYDLLFESACREKDRPFLAITGDSPIPTARAETVIVKLSGSIAVTDEFFFTECDVWDPARVRPRLWNSLRPLVDESTLVVVGSSLHDVGVKDLLYHRRPDAQPAYLVIPDVQARFRRFGLDVIAAEAGMFFDTLVAEIAALPDR